MQIRRVVGILIALFAVASLHGGQKRFHPVVLDAILAAECAVVDGRYYPYFIGFNNDAAKAFARKLFPGMKFDGRLMYCLDEKSCVAAALRLTAAGYDNIDLGPYQINPRYHPQIPILDLFNYSKARAHARSILDSLAERHGATWEAIGRYHSARADLNRRYFMKLYNYIYGRRTQ